MRSILFDYVVGTGGIGRGVLFQLAGNHTIGRSESRQASLTDFRDYCKLHIILHYIAVFLKGALPVYAIGRVGGDEQGRELKKEMEEAGITVDFVREDAERPTMYAVCCQYPDGECCNISSQNSACQSVGKEDVETFYRTACPKGKGLVLAAPEVPLAARICLLQHGRRKGSFNVASVLSGEVEDFVRQGGVEVTDLIALNEDEAKAFAGLREGSKENGVEKGKKEEEGKKEKGMEKEREAEACVRLLQEKNRDICVIITRGSGGALARFRDKTYRCDGIRVPVASTAGAGDCFLGTVLAALILGLEMFPLEDQRDDGKLASALDLGNVAAGRKVKCRDTIDFSMNAETLLCFAEEHGLVFSGELKRRFLGNECGQCSGVYGERTVHYGRTDTGDAGYYQAFSGSARTGYGEYESEEASDPCPGG